MWFRANLSLVHSARSCRISFLLGAAATGALFSAVSRPASAAVTYTATGLGSASGDTGSLALGISNNGAIVGQSDSGSQGIYSTGSGFTGLGTFGGSSGIAAAVNAAGVVAGSASDANGNIYGYTYQIGSSGGLSTANQLPSFGGGNTSANGINSAGTVVGSSYYAATNGFAYKWTPGSNSLTPLDPAGGGTGLGGASGGGSSSEANGINSAGLIVGDATSSVFSNASDAPEQHAFLYSGSQMYDLGTNGASSGSSSIARAINDNGVIVGNITDFNTGEPEAFSYSGYDTSIIAPTSDTPLNGSFTMLDPGPTPMFASTDATAINSSGEIVGNATDSLGDPVGFLYIPGKGIESLDDLSGYPVSGIDVQFATGINDAGDIVGYGSVDGGETEAILLTPVPEPATLSLVLVAGLSIRRRRRR
jgi:probable HAF family extracellular repeat protein